MFIYALKSAVVLSLLYIPYQWLLCHESFFRFNRFAMNFIMLLSLLLPFCNLPALSVDENPVISAVHTQMMEAGIPVKQADIPATMVAGGDISWFAIAAALYLLVALVLLAVSLRDYARLHHIIRRGCLWKRTNEQGITIYCHVSDIPSFSWLRSIVISEQDYRQDGDCIIAHECGHILHHHSADLLLLSVVQTLQWFNPFVWMIGLSLRDVHEYEADAHVLRQGISTDDYRKLLIIKAVGASKFAFVNNFNHSLIKKRINMMYQKKSHSWCYAKALYILPLSLLAMCLFATPQFKTTSEIIALKLTPAKSIVMSRATPTKEKAVVRTLYQQMLVGDWVQPIPGQSGVQGIKLRADGTAQSIHMATLQYHSWQTVNGNLVLYGESVGNGQTFPFADTLYISNLTSSSLTLKRGEAELVYSRQ